jgi:hypothetical protein
MSLLMTGDGKLWLVLQHCEFLPLALIINSKLHWLKHAKEMYWIIEIDNVSNCHTSDSHTSGKHIKGADCR